MNTMKAIDITGQRFGRLTAIRLERRGTNARYWLCKCDCGKEKFIYQNSLRLGRSQSCGCLQPEVLRVIKATHGNTRGHQQSPEYRAWMHMIRRCSRENEASYHRYGARGIVVCERWHDFSAFIADMGAKPSPRHSLDRKDNNGPYEPGNVQWSLPKAQANNRSSNHIIEFGGIRKTISEWADTIGIHQDTLKQRIYRGWSIERAITEPIRNLYCVDHTPE